MAYTRQTWTSRWGRSLLGALWSSAISRDTMAQRLDHMEDGIYDLDLRVKYEEPLNVMWPEFGAVGDGVADDTAAIEAAMVVGDPFMPPGNYLVNRVAREFFGHHSCISVRNGRTLSGAGPGKTTVTQGPNQPHLTSDHVIDNRQQGGGANHDRDVVIKDFTLDCNGDQQIAGAYAHGIYLLRARRITIENIVIKDLYGDADFPPGETLGINLNECSDANVINTHNMGENGTQGTGFGDNVSTNVHYIGCVAENMSHGFGFATWTSRHIHYTDCHARGNAVAGFNAEIGQNVMYENCTSGGLSANSASTPPWFAANTDLGNTHGFIMNDVDNAKYVNCHASHNTQKGLIIVNGGSGVATNCHFIDNESGLSAAALADFANFRVDRTCIIQPNTVNAIWFNYGFVGQTGPLADRDDLPTPNVGASTAYVKNEYPFDVMVYLIGGTITDVALNPGARVIGPQRVIKVGAHEEIAITHSLAPTWKWSRL